MLSLSRIRTAKYDGGFPEAVGRARSCVSSFASKAVRAFQPVSNIITLECLQ